MHGQVGVPLPFISTCFVEFSVFLVVFLFFYGLFVFNCTLLEYLFLFSTIFSETCLCLSVCGGLG